MKPRTYDQMVKALVMELNKSHIQYAATGAIAASYYGRPRSTTDVDFIVKVDPKNLSVFLRPLHRAGLDPDLSRIQTQLASGYNVVTVRDKFSSYDADFILHPTGPLPRRPGTLKGVRAFYQTPEELILAKLRMIKATVSEERAANDKADIQGILTNTKVNRRKIIQAAKRETTLEVFRNVTRKPASKKFKTSLPEFHYKEESHEASRYLFKGTQTHSRSHSHSKDSVRNRKSAGSFQQ